MANVVLAADMHRRRLLALLGTGALPVAGCLSAETPGDEPTPSPAGADEDPTPLPEACPTTQGIEVEWPEDLDAAAVESFVEAYERAYYREVVVQYEPESQLDSYELSGLVMDDPIPTGDGWVLKYAGNGGVYRPTLFLEATVAEPPEGGDVVPINEIDDEPATETLEEAARKGEASYHVEPPGPEVDRYLELFESVSADFKGLSGPGDADTLYVAVEDTTVELTVTADNFHGDYQWYAWYYVDERIVRRTTDQDTDPREGQLLECRRLD